MVNKYYKKVESQDIETQRERKRKMKSYITGTQKYKLFWLNVKLTY